SALRCSCSRRTSTVRVAAVVAAARSGIGAAAGSTTTKGRDAGIDPERSLPGLDLLLRRRRLPRRRLGARLHPWNSAEGGRADPVHLSGVVVTHYEWRGCPDDRAKRPRIVYLHPKARPGERQVPVRPGEPPARDALVRPPR